MKSNIFFRNFSLCLILLGGLFFQACEEDESFDVVGNPDNIVYILPAIKSFDMVSTPVGFFGNKISAGFKVKATQPMVGSATVTATIDNSLVDNYNKKNETEYMTCNASLQKATATINEGEYASFDSIVVILPENNYTEITKKGSYLIPVKLSSITNEVLSTEYNVVYLVINVEEKQINEGAGSSEIQGNIITGKSEWTATSTDSSVDDFSSIFDKNNSTGVTFNEPNPVVTIDMQKINNVSALQLINSDGSGWDANYLNYSNIQVQLSTDGETWVNAGSVDPTIEDSINQYIIMYGEVPCRYVRITLTWQYSWFGYLFNEINIYATE